MSKYLIILFFLSFASCTQKPEKINELVIIAHRGAPGYLPEHTLESKAMAFAMHPDYIEQDIVLSKDDIPIVIHDIHLDAVSNVKEVFPDRKRTDGRYYVIDFTWAELQQLNVTERFDYQTGNAIFPNRFPIHKSHFKLHTLQDEIELIQGLNQSTGKDIGIYPEIKAPAFHRKEGKDISKIVLEILAAYGYKDENSNCILQCFDYQENKRIRNELKSKLTLVQLMEFETEKDSLENISQYVQGIGPSLNFLKDKNFVENVRKKGLFIHAYTLRTDVIPNWQTTLQTLNLSNRIDGVFTDQPDQVFKLIHPQ